MSREVNDGDVVIEQGPEWLVELGYGDPGWLPGVLVLAMLAVVAIAGVAYRRNGIGTEVAREMSEIGAIVMAIWLCTTAFVQLFAFAYVVDVIAGTGLGFLGGKGFALAFWQSYESAQLDKHEGGHSSQQYE